MFQLTDFESVCPHPVHKCHSCELFKALETSWPVVLFVLLFIMISLSAYAHKCSSMLVCVRALLLQIPHPHVSIQYVVPNEAVVMTTKRLIDTYCYQCGGGRGCRVCLGLCGVGCRVHALKRDLGCNSPFQTHTHAEGCNSLSDMCVHITHSNSPDDDLHFCKGLD